MISLGINYSQMHDSAACLVRDGEVLFAVAEERLSRVKHDARFPVLAIRACLDFAKLRLSDLDFICYGWPRARKSFQHDLRCFLNGSHPLEWAGAASTAVRFVRSLLPSGRDPFTRNFGPARACVLGLDHHLAHAISAYAFSGFEKSAVLVVDGRGAWEATSLWYGDAGRLEHLSTIPWPNSLGLFYAQFTQHLGFQSFSDEWKVMGLAPYGQPAVDLRDFIHPDDHPYRVNTRRLLGPHAALALDRSIGPRRIPESEIERSHKNAAFAVQDACERAMLTLARWAVEQTGCRNLSFAGGVALNSKANGKILSSGLLDAIFIQPAAGDDGACLGAAFAPYIKSGERLPLQAMRHAFLGPESTAAEIEKILQTYKLAYTRPSDLPAAAAQMLAERKILGWFQGRMEFGPRALGNRSILGDPRDPEMNAKVNRAVKFREWWRPFAPSLLAESAAEYMESAHDSPFMILTAQVRPEKRSVIPAVTHVDGSARPQTVSPNVNPRFRQLIAEFGARTGVPVILNTSFNLRGEPIVCTPTEAIRTFFSSGMDALVVGDFIVSKARGRC